MKKSIIYVLSTTILISLSGCTYNQHNYSVKSINQESTSSPSSSLTTSLSPSAESSSRKEKATLTTDEVTKLMQKFPEFEGSAYSDMTDNSGFYVFFQFNAIDGKGTATTWTVNPSNGDLYDLSGKVICNLLTDQNTENDKRVVTSTALDQTTTPIISKNTSHSNKLFAPIIDAYAALERSGYTSFDKDIIGDSLLTNKYTYNFGTSPTLMYTFYDINSDGSPELLIGANESISSIYVLQNGTPVSIIQVESRHNIDLLMDNNGKCVIGDSWGHMGYATDFFYTIDKDGKLITLDKLYTNGDDKKVDTGTGFKLISHFRTKDVQGKHVNISEKEYCSLMQKYGSTGYEPLEDIKNTGKEGTIQVTWKPVATYK